MIQLLPGDAREVLPTLAAHSIDAIITDPPYEIGFDAWDKSGVAHDPDFWREALRVLKPGGKLLAFSGTRTYHRMTMAIEQAGFQVGDMLGWLYTNGMPRGADISKAMPADDAAEWAGWYTTLKPMIDPICAARKPIGARTIPENVRRWGTGAFNVGACRVNERRPGNILVDEDTRAWLATLPHDPSRCFFSAKAQPDERQAGCAAIGGNTIGCVKPLALLRYLCRLVTPPGGTILDPFAGSGSTCIAAGLEGFTAIGVELHPTHVAIATARVQHWLPGTLRANANNMLSC